MHWISLDRYVPFEKFAKKNESLNLNFNYDQDIKEKLETTAREHDITHAKVLVLLDFFRQFILRLEELHGHIKLQDKKE